MSLLGEDTLHRVVVKVATGFSPNYRTLKEVRLAFFISLVRLLYHSSE